MRARLAALRREDGFGLIELMVATLIVTIALLALVAGYDSAAVSITNSRLKSTAMSLANQQMELYSSLPFASIGLDQTETDDIGNAAGADYDSLYATNSILDGTWTTDTNGNPIENPSGTVNDYTIDGCGSTPQCEPIQSVVGPDGHTYRIDTYIVEESNNATTSSIRWTERVVTVIVRDAQASGDPELVELTEGFDRGPTS